MELKTNYQYTYFIHPFIIKDGEYQKYIQKMLKDKNFKLKNFEKEKDINLYKYFLPKTREFLFSSFSNIFEYIPEQDIQAKIDDKKGIFFTIPKVDVICFNTGICFLVIKTNLTDYEDFANILNFNYKFRDIKQESDSLNSYDNIRLQTHNFADIETFKEFINDICGSNTEATKLNLYTQRFLTYSYVCIDGQNWDVANEFFNKYANVLPADNSSNLEAGEVAEFSRWKYAKIALSKLGILLFSSSTDMNNYTVLPHEYENQYLYTYIINLYKKIYLKKLQSELKNKKKMKKARKKFAEFTKDIWKQEITEDEIGTKLNNKIIQTLELEKLYEETKNEYEILYKNFNIEKNCKFNIITAIVLGISLILNLVNFIALMNR